MNASSNLVAVIGAGPAGITAAAAASAGGARVVLIENSRRLGGSVTAAMHRSICGLYADAPSSPLETLNDGWQRTVVRKMLGHSPSLVQPRRFGKAWVLEFPPAAWAFSLEAICDEGKIDRRMATRVSTVRREGDHLSAIELTGDRPGRLKPKIVIDCTGGGSVMAMAGGDVIQPPEESSPRMLAGYGVRLAGIDGHLELLRLQIPYALAKAVQAGELPEVARFTVFYPGPGAGEGVCKLALPTSTSEHESHARAEAIVAVLRKHLPGFGSAVVTETSPHAVPRDGDRLLGLATLTEADVLAGGAASGDAIKAWWPIEHWSETAGPMYAYPPVGQPYAIPIDVLRSAKINNLLAAGNAISATFAAAASSRASGICLATGDAAGRLATSLL